ncbi:MAG: TolB family protein, partial [Candidatus Bipolaricaulia bacterium]
GQFDIYTMNPDGSDLRRLTSGTGNNEAPSWSPDGRHIAFSSDRSGIPQIYIMRADGSGQRPVTRLAGGGYAPSWSP